jgi:hypothetical protein
MANLIISEYDAKRLQEIAQREKRPVEEIISQLIDGYSNSNSHHEEQQSVSSYLAKLFATARKYWHDHNDTDRLALTDDQLTKQFWCIDPEGIPRLKSEQNNINIPSDNLLTFLESVWQDNPMGEVEEPINYREILNKDFSDYLTRRMQDNDDQPSID